MSYSKIATKVVQYKDASGKPVSSTPEQFSALVSTLTQLGHKAPESTEIVTNAGYTSDFGTSGVAVHATLGFVAVDSDGATRHYSTTEGIDISNSDIDSWSAREFVDHLLSGGFDVKESTNKKAGARGGGSDPTARPMRAYAQYLGLPIGERGRIDSDHPIVAKFAALPPQHKLDWFALTAK